MGVGDMTVNSYLNQPFNAEIQLIDVGHTPLSDIKASLASNEDFERVGLERSNVLDLLTLAVDKNAENQPVIKVQSFERITEPYMQVLVDVAWPNGQMYRAYTILLDPPNYQLILDKTRTSHGVTQPQVVHSGQVHSEKTDLADNSPPDTEQSTATTERKWQSYGPTQAQETIWQIAQRYTSSEVNTQQMILAILGSNPGAFEQENLNGLQKGVMLKIPPAAIASTVPQASVKFEVQAQDKAWQYKQPTAHVILPPYFNEETAEAAPTEPDTTAPDSQIPTITTAFSSSGSHFIPPGSSFLSASEDVAPGRTMHTNPQALSALQQVKLKTEMDIAAMAIESVRQTNAVLSEQLRTLQGDNKTLQQELKQREQEINTLHAKVRLIMQRQGLGGQVSQQSLESTTSLWPWVLFVVLLLAGTVFLFWRFAWWPNPSSSTSPPEDIPNVKENVRKPLIDSSVSFLMEKPENVPEEEAGVMAIPREVRTREHSDEYKPPKSALVNELVIPLSPRLAREVPPDSPLQQSSDTLSADLEPRLSPPTQVPEESPAEESSDASSTASSEPRIGSDSEISAKPATDLFSKEPSGELAVKAFPMQAEPESPDPELTALLQAMQIPSIEKTQLTGEPEPAVSDSAHVLEYQAEPLKKDRLTPKDEEDELSDGEHSIEFVPNPVPSEKQKPGKEKPITNQAAEESLAQLKKSKEPAKSHSALDTLLALAKTYIGMEDYEAAKQSLHEVLQHGSENQKKEAKRLLSELK